MLVACGFPLNTCGNDLGTEQLRHGKYVTQIAPLQIGIRGFLVDE